MVAAVGVRNKNTGIPLQECIKVLRPARLLVVVNNNCLVLIQLSAAVDKHPGLAVPLAPVLVHGTSRFVCLNHRESKQFAAQSVTEFGKVAQGALVHPVCHGGFRDINTIALKFLPDTV